MNHRFFSMIVGLATAACANEGASDSSAGSESSGGTTLTSTTTSASVGDGTPSSSDDGGPSDGDSSPPEGSSGGDETSSSGGSTGNGERSCADYLFCEDFELGNPGEVPPGWAEHAGWDQGGSRAVLSSAQAHGGAQSLASAVGTNGQYRIEHDLDVLGDAVTNHWGRIFYKVKTPVALDGMYVHNTFVAFGRPEGSNGNESRVVDTVVDPQGTHQFLFNVPDDSCCAGSSYDYSYDDEWHCAEWYVEGDTQSFRFFYDGVEVTDIAFSGNQGAHIDGFASIIVGWIDYQNPSTPNEGWFDDLAIDDAQIGCD